MLEWWSGRFAHLRFRVWKGFYDVFIDRRQWPALIRQGHEATVRALDALRVGDPVV